MRVVGIAGSLRRGSYNRLLLRAAVASAPVGMTILISEELASIPPFNEDLDLATGEGPEGVQRLLRQVRSADGLLIATPEYNHSLPGVLKNALDWLSRPAPDEVLSGKPVAIVGASSGRWGTRLAQGALRQILYATESLVLPKPSVFLGEAARLFDEVGRLSDAQTSRQLGDLLSEFARWIETVGQDHDQRSSISTP